MTKWTGFTAEEEEEELSDWRIQFRLICGQVHFHPESLLVAPSSNLDSSDPPLQFIHKSSLRPLLNRWRCRPQLHVFHPLVHRLRPSSVIGACFVVSLRFPSSTWTPDPLFDRYVWMGDINVLLVSQELVGKHWHCMFSHTRRVYGGRLKKLLRTVSGNINCMSDYEWLYLSVD